MKERSVKTRTDCLALLKELVIVLPGALTNHVGTLIPGIQFSLRYYILYNFYILILVINNCLIIF